MTALVAGQRVGRFVLHAPLGRGAMGEVWAATLCGPEGFEKPVALKVLRAGPVEDKSRRALLAEARLGARLQHPNIVATFDLSEVDGRWHLAMERVEGCTLTALLAAGPLSSAAVVDVGLQTCAGLAHLHRAGLVHRDLKPSNLLVDRSGLVKIADLGIARFAADETEAAGTYGYMPPEQAEGTVDARSDLFALGVVLYAAATAQPLFPRGAAALLAAIRVEARLADPGFLAPADAALPGLGEVIRRCIRFEPEDRFSTAGELSAALAALRPAATGASLLQALARARPELTVEPSHPDPSASPLSSNTLARVRGNLPAQRDRFLGREEEVPALMAQLRSDRLVTVHAPGGMGKTRTALEAARRLGPELAGGAWFFDLSNATDAASLCAEVARGLGVGLDARDPIVAVGSALADRQRALFVLDNLEQAAEAAATCVTRWLALAPDALFLATSRQALRVRSERLFPLGALTNADAVALFRERSLRPPEPADAPEVSALVDALDGMPLAIELAAARTRILSPAEIRRRLSRRLELLAGGGSDRPDRQRSLRASLDGSWELLTPWQRAALCQLASFEGGFTLEAAEAVLDLAAWPDAPWAVDVVQSLTEASLVRAHPATGRFGMLLGIQAYASERATPAERRATAERHGAWFSQFGTDVSLAATRRLGGTARLRALALDVDNLVAACTRALARGDAELASLALRAAGEIFVGRGPASTAASLAAAVLAHPGLAPAQRARACKVAGDAARLVGDNAACERWYVAGHEAYVAAGDGVNAAVLETGVIRMLAARDVAAARAAVAAALPRTRALGDPDALAHQLAFYAECCRAANDLDAARAPLGEVLALLRQAGDVRAEAVYLADEAELLHMLGGDSDTVTRYERVLALHAEAENRTGTAKALASLGNVLASNHHLSEAEHALQSALAIAREIGVRPIEAFALLGLAQLATLRGRREDARSLLAQADAAQGRSGLVSLAAVLCIEHGRALARLGQVAAGRAQVADGLGRLAAAGMTHQTGYAYLEAGELELEDGDFTTAAAHFERAVAVLEAARDRRDLPRARRRLANAYAALGRAAEAHAMLVQARAEHGVNRNFHDVGLVWCDLAALAERAGAARTAAEALAEASRAAALVGADYETELDRRLSRTPPARR